MTVLAYSYHDIEVDIWDHLCPECHDFMVTLGQYAEEADAELINLNGDVIRCCSCGREIRDGDTEGETLANLKRGQ